MSAAASSRPGLGPELSRAVTFAIHHPGSTSGTSRHPPVLATLLACLVHMQGADGFIDLDKLVDVLAQYGFTRESVADSMIELARVGAVHRDRRRARARWFLAAPIAREVLEARRKELGPDLRVIEGGRVVAEAKRPR